MASGAPTAASYSAINIVRARAGEQPLTAGLSASAFRDSVVFERAYEFCGENGMRWFDICRLQLLPTIVAARSTDFQDPRPVENPIPTAVLSHLADRYLAPIPQADMFLNPQWTQNAGY
jgi:hypothetical protein